MKKLRSFLITVIFIGLVFTGLKMCLVHDMNKRELWYDADGPFIMVDASTGLVGIYNGTDPIDHFYTWVDKKIDPFTVITLGDVEDYGLQIRKSCETCPDDTPVLIYFSRR